MGGMIIKLLFHHHGNYEWLLKEAVTIWGLPVWPISIKLILVFLWSWSPGLAYLVGLIMGDRCKICCLGWFDQSLSFPGFAGLCPLSNWQLWLSHSFRYESWCVWEVILFKNYWKVWDDISPVLKRQKRYKINLIE